MPAATTICIDSALFVIERWLVVAKHSFFVLYPEFSIAKQLPAGRVSAADCGRPTICPSGQVLRTWSRT